MATRFIDLPDLVKTWLLSQEVTGHIIAIEQRLEMGGDEIKIVPAAITQLVIGRLDPRQFIARLQRELGLNFEEARATAQEIYAKILKPVAVSLRNEGVDAALITEGTPLTDAKDAKQMRMMRNEIAATDAKNARPAPMTRNETPPRTNEDAPFILHREHPTTDARGADITRMTQHEPPARPPEIKPSFVYKPKETPAPAKSAPPAPPKARIETPATDAKDAKGMRMMRNEVAATDAKDAKQMRMMRNEIAATDAKDAKGMRMMQNKGGGTRTVHYAGPTTPLPKTNVE